MATLWPVIFSQFSEEQASVTTIYIFDSGDLDFEKGGSRGQESHHGVFANQYWKCSQFHQNVRT